MNGRFVLDAKLVPTLAGNLVYGWSVLDVATGRVIGDHTMRCTAQLRLERLTANPPAMPLADTRWAWQR